MRQMGRQWPFSRFGFSLPRFVATDFRDAGRANHLFASDPLYVQGAGRCGMDGVHLSWRISAGLARFQRQGRAVSHWRRARPGDGVRRARRAAHSLPVIPQSLILARCRIGRVERGLPNPPFVLGFTDRFGRRRSACPIYYIWPVSVTEALLVKAARERRSARSGRGVQARLGYSGACF